MSFDIDIVFSKIPKATLSDDLNETFCYAEAANLIKKAVANNRYNLIEKLAADVHSVLKHTLEEQGFDKSSISVTVIKLAPPVVDIHGGVSFTYHG